VDAAPGGTLEAIRESGPAAAARPGPRDGTRCWGVLYVTDAFAALSRGEPLDLRRLMREVPVVYENADALQVIGSLRRSENHMGLVYDEYGSFQGIVTTGDILEAITGAFREEAARRRRSTSARTARCWCRAGWRRTSSPSGWGCRASSRGTTRRWRGWC
jgi:putative hemolysin